MANTDKPFGARPVSSLSGDSYTGELNVYYVPDTDATAIFRGDFVKMAGSADATGKYPTVAQVAAGDTSVLGVAVAFSVEAPQIAADPSDLGRRYRAASTAMYVYVADGPDLLVEMQEDSDGAAIAVAGIGLNYDVVVGSGDTATGQSAMEIDSSTGATTATLPLQVLRLVDREDNELGNHAKWICKINTHSLRSTTGE